MLQAKSAEGSSAGEAFDIQRYVLTLLRECKGDSGKAEERLEKRARVDQALLDAVLGPFSSLSKICHLLVQRAQIGERDRLWNGKTEASASAALLKSYAAPNYDIAQKGERILLLAQHNRNSLFNFPLNITGHPLLGNATRTMVAEAVQAFLKPGKDMVQKALWLNSILSCMSAKNETKTVREQLSEAQLVEFKREADDFDVEKGWGKKLATA